MSANAKDLLFDAKARNALREGIDIVANLAKETLGPKGKNISIDASFGSPTMTSDGYRIAKEVELSDSFAQLGVKMAQEMVSKIKDKEGDGTTTSLLLLQALVQGGITHIAAGESPIQIKRELDALLPSLLENIDKMALPVSLERETKEISSAAASGNEEVGEFLFQAFQKVGKEGIVLLEEGSSTETSIELVDGMEIDRGYVSPYFCTNKEKMWVEMDKPFLLLTDKKISSVQDILPILQQVASMGRSLLLLADDVEGDVISTLVVNKMRGTLQAACIKAPGFGDQRKALLEDIAALTGAEVVSEEKGMSLAESGMEVLGQADSILITKDKTTIVRLQGTKDAIQKRIQAIDAALTPTLSSYDREQLLKRKGKLQGGVARILVGAATESEMKKKKELFQDSLAATRSALRGGVVVGGGVALLRLRETLKKGSLGEEIVKKALQAPFRQIVSNSGFDPSLVSDQVLSSKDPHLGFDAKSDTTCNLQKAGVFDPAPVVKSSLTHAFSMAGIVLLTETLVVPKL